MISITCKLKRPITKLLLCLTFRPQFKNIYGDPCSGQYLENFTTDTLTDHNDEPFLFHLGRDPGESYPIK